MSHRRVGVFQQSSPAGSAFANGVAGGHTQPANCPQAARRRTSGFFMRGLASMLPVVPEIKKERGHKLSMQHTRLQKSTSLTVPQPDSPKNRRHSFHSSVALPDNVYDFIGAIPWLNDASESFRKKLASCVGFRLSRQGEMIIKKGETGKAVFFLSRGVVDVISEDGEVVFSQLSDGALFGEIAILFDTPRTCSIRAATNCMLLTLKKDTFQELLEEEETLKARVMEQANTRLKKLAAKIDSGLFGALGDEFVLPIVTNSLSSMRLFDGCDGNFLYQLALGVKPKLYQAGENIVVEDSPGTEMFFLVRGRVQVSSSLGNQSREMESGSFFGEIAMIYDVKRTATVKAITSCDVLIIPKSVMQSVMKDRPEIAKMIKEEAHIRCPST
eukprot:m.25830 g.25830  ORF g.25830 m.25830 type:complete len:386 (+) comp28985_c0_seq2:126-1283(+)